MMEKHKAQAARGSAFAKAMAVVNRGKAEQALKATAGGRSLDDGTLSPSDTANASPGPIDAAAGPGDRTQQAAPAGVVPVEVQQAVAQAGAEIVSTSAKEVVRQLNRDHFVGAEGGQAFVFREGADPETGRPWLERMTVAGFRQLHAHRVVEVADNEGNATTRALADLWFRDKARRTFDRGFAFLPAGRVPPGVYNLWRGFGAQPLAGATESDAAPALAHIRDVICSGVGGHYEYLIGWLARAVQEPAEPAEVAVVLQGGRGTGKGTLGRWFCELFGAHGLHISNSRHLTGNFNGHLRSCLALFVDEAFFVGDRAGNAVLKSLVTEPELVLEAKGQDAIQARNRLKILMASNDEHVILAGADERRYFVLEVGDTKRQDHAYFDKLDRWWRAGGKEALLGYLLEYDISKFNIRSVPNTKALERQKLESLDAFDQWLLEYLNKPGWCESMEPKEITQRFKFFVQEHGLRYENTSADSVGRRLRKRMAVRRIRGSETGRPWKWVLPRLRDARAQFMTAVGATEIEWAFEPADSEDGPEGGAGGENAWLTFDYEPPEEAVGG